MITKLSKHRFIFGTWIIFFGGIFPAVVGGINYFIFLRSFLSKSFSFPDRDFGRCDILIDPCHLIGQVGFTNLIMTGISISVISKTALLNKEKWAWWLLLFMVLWVGGNDSFFTVYYYLKFGYSAPIPLIPTSLCLIGLVLTGKEVFSKE